MRWTTVPFMISDVFTRLKTRNLPLLVAISLGVSSMGIGSATAHAVPESIVVLKSQADQVKADVSIPISELALVVQMERPVTADTIAAHSDEISAYLGHHAFATAEDGTKWETSVSDLGLGEGQDHDGRYAILKANLTFTPPSRQLSSFLLHYDAILSHVVTHKVHVFYTDAEGAPQGGVIRSDPKMSLIEPFPIPDP